MPEKTTTEDNTRFKMGFQVYQNFQLNGLVNHPANTVDDILWFEGVRMPSQKELYDMMRNDGAEIVCDNAELPSLDDYLDMAGIPSTEYELHLFDAHVGGTYVGATHEGRYRLSLVKSSLRKYLSLAAVDFGIGSNGEINITQIQGRSSRFENLPFNPKEELPKQWAQKLLKAAIYWASDLRFAEMTGQKAEDNLYYNEPHNIRISDSEELKRHQDTMRMRYNVTFERAGFKYDESRKLYALNLQDRQIREHNPLYNSVFV